MFLVLGKCNILRWIFFQCAFDLRSIPPQLHLEFYLNCQLFFSVSCYWTSNRGKSQCSSMQGVLQYLCLLFPHPLQFLYRPKGIPSKCSGPPWLVGGGETCTQRVCACVCVYILSPDAQEDIDMVIVSTPVKRRCPLGTAMHPPLSERIL